MAFVPAKTESLNSFITRYEYEIKGGDNYHTYLFLSEKEVNAKREKYVINLRSMVEEAKFFDENTVTLTVKDQGDIKVRLGELLPVIFNTPMDKLELTRIALYGWNGGWIKPLERSEQWIAKL